MGKTIASTYVINEKIGAGGVGVVYKGEHTRLHIPIVLKAEKLRDGGSETQYTLSTRKKALHQEVDVLKKLNHMYLPRVYDFVEEGDTSYTIMDFIEGESLDHPLKRGDYFSQPQVVEIACELLEALSYLHSHGFLHSDIKPENIMLTPQGDIRLIDFNVALALNGEAPLRIGRSPGYASPEHYPENYDEDSTQTGSIKSETEALENGNGASNHSSNVPSNSSGVRQSSSGTFGNRNILLDVRSDIYSLGATLYHLLTGVRPPKKAAEVPPLQTQKPGISPVIARIIQKAMDPDPDKRYQTADEMLYAFEHLREADPRTRLQHVLIALAILISTVILLIGSRATYIGLRQSERLKNNLVLAGESVEALRAGNVSGAISSALEALPEEPTIFDPPYTAQAQRALTNALGVYDLSDGYKSFCSIPLPSEPIKVALSPDGMKIGVLLNEDGIWRIKIISSDGKREFASLDAEASVLSDFVFVDNETLIYAGTDGLSAYNLAENSSLWPEEDRKHVTGLSLAADANLIATVYRDETSASIYNTVTGALLQTIDFAGKKMKVSYNDVFQDRGDNLFTVDSTGKWLAVSFTDGSLDLFSLEDGIEDISILPSTGFTHFEGGFYDDCFAFAAYGAKEGAYAVFAVANLETRNIIVSSSLDRAPHLQADESGIYLSAENNLIQINPWAVTAEDVQMREVAHTNDDITAFSIGSDRVLILTADGRYLFYNQSSRLIAELTSTDRIDFATFAGDFVLSANRDKQSLVLQRWERYPDRQMFTYDPSYFHREARVHTDEETALLFEPIGAGGFRIIDQSGQVLHDIPLLEPEQIYDQQYRRPGARDFLKREVGREVLEILYNNGLIRSYSAKTGELLSEEMGERPDGTLDQDFQTESYYIVAPLHGRPKVYDKSGEKLLAELEDAFLAYAVQINDCLLTDYVTAEGDRYSLLLDANLEVIAELPDLCDVLPDGTVVFDDTVGDLRQSRIYAIEELIAIAKQEYEEAEQ